MVGSLGIRRAFPASSRLGAGPAAREREKVREGRLLKACEILLPVLLLLATGCHDVTEYSEQGEYAVYKIDLGTMTVVSSLGGFEGGRALLSIGNTEFLVASNRGVLYRVSSPEMAVLGVFPAGGAYATGYGSMVQTSSSTVYLVGSYGNIVEFSLATGSVADVFSAGPAPAGVTCSSDGGSIFVIDAQDAGLREFDTSDNSFVRSVELETPASVIVRWTDSPYQYLLALSSLEPAAYPVWVEYLLPSSVGLARPASDIAAFRDTTIFCACHGGSGPGMATVSAGYPIVERTETIALSGQPLRACSEQVHHSFYVASLIDGTTTRIYEIDGLDCTITRTLDVPGYPWDITAHANGEYLLILTST